MSRVPLAFLLLLAACDRSPVQAPPTARNDSVEQPAPPQNRVAEAPLNPPAPGQPGGLPDDRTPVAEGPFAETSPQGAASVLERYFALIEQRRYAEAWRLWSDEGRASGKSEADFAADLGRYREYHANIGAPGDAEGAAGSLYVEVPVQVYGRLANGEAFNATGTATLRRVNDVPGSTAEQRRWHIHAVDVMPPR
jgi:hypothetical protein